MMSRHFSKVGVWLFVAAFAWYMGGNFLLDNLMKEKIAYAKSNHVRGRYADTGSSNKVVIRALGGDFYVEHIDLIFDATVSQAVIDNEDILIAASTQLSDDVLHVEFREATAPVSSTSSTKILVRLPSTVRQVELAGIHSVNISGSLPATDAELVLKSLDCAPQLTMKQLQVNNLKLIDDCQAPPKQGCCITNFSLSEQIHVGKLEVAMQHGKLEYTSEAIPQQTLLNVSDNVQITGRRDFLQSLRFNNGSP